MQSSTQLVASNNAAWFKTWFDSSFYHALYANRNETEAADFIDELIAELQPWVNSRMLDLGCGAGRHAKQLASKGHHVTGFDLAFSSIQTARKFETGNLHFYQRDMRVPFGKNHFDYVFNFFTSFGYFESEAENQNVIRNIHSALKSGGTLVLDYLNVDYAEERSIPKEEKEIDGIIYHITRWADENHFFKRIVIDNIQSTGQFEYTEKVAKLRLADFERLFICNGLQLQKVYGDYYLKEYDIQNSPRLILKATKR